MRRRAITDAEVSLRSSILSLLGVDLAKRCGLESLSQDQPEEFLQQVTEVVDSRLKREFRSMLSDEERVELEELLTNRGDVRDFLNRKTRELDSTVEDVPAVLKRLESRYSDGRISKLDGLSVDYPDWHFNVRPSNTEPWLRLNLEAFEEAEMELRREEVA